MGRKDPICKTSAKSNIGHTEPAAGMIGLIKCMSMNMLSGVPANVHLRKLNAHIDTDSYPVIFPDEFCDLGINSSFTGVSSFGAGGSNARGDVWARCTKGPRRTGGELVTDKLGFLHAKKQDLLARLAAIQDPDIDDRLKERMQIDLQKEEIDMAIKSVDSEERYRFNA